MSNLQAFKPCAGEPVISEICSLAWGDLSESDMVSAAWAYYYFSIQFRENLEIACAEYPDDQNLARLKLEECDTDNLSPYPEITTAGEKLDHDEFMRRALSLSPLTDETLRRFEAGGARYLEEVRAMSPHARALSIANYESGGLERLFKAMLQAPVTGNRLVAAFRFFMEEHIRFDSDPIQGHGALSRTITGDADIRPLWEAYKRLLLEFAPNLQPA
jgi:hypothetical protein